MSFPFFLVIYLLMFHIKVFPLHPNVQVNLIIQRYVVCFRHMLAHCTYFLQHLWCYLKTKLTGYEYVRMALRTMET